MVTHAKTKLRKSPCFGQVVCVTKFYRGLVNLQKAIEAGLPIRNWWIFPVRYVSPFTRGNDWKISRSHGCVMEGLSYAV